jgi:two-component system NtrC family response regulator
MSSILIIDDDPGFGRVLAEVAKSQGHKPSWAVTLANGLDMALRVAPDIVFLDVNLPDGNGLGAIAPLRNIPSRPEIIVITGLVDAEGAETAIQGGAWDYVEKSSSQAQLILSLKRALRFREASRAGTAGLKRQGIAGNGARLALALAEAARAAAGDLPVLLNGETGTGKELFARCIHENSARARKPFVVVDCAALPQHLAESLLFGHAKGAFTSADSEHEGLVKAAHKGTLFLDEVGELPLGVQKVFLRVLQERRFRPVGATAEVESDFRLIAATNRDLESMAAQGLFREDLLHRLRASELRLPPLRERLEDLAALVEHRLGQAPGGRSVSPELLAELSLYPWPGNVRELFQILDKAAAKAGKEQQLFPEHLPAVLRAKTMKARFGARATDPAPAATASTLNANALPPYREYREQAVFVAEGRYLRALFQAAGGSPKRACEISGLSRTRVYNLAKAHGIRSGRGD